MNDTEKLHSDLTDKLDMGGDLAVPAVINELVQEHYTVEFRMNNLGRYTVEIRSNLYPLRSVQSSTASNFLHNALHNAVVALDDLINS